ncbi:MAG: AraC family transcriptional regulator ligand-binding domain-containing protein [Reichenbachiella sp.]|uniref:AraC family transcriptional regulator n=1 Tax=Reichenbachiella sp. TaxID=2184521 RepID=UPI0032657A4A
MRRSKDIPVSLINLRIAVGETFGARRATVIEDANLTEKVLSSPTSRVSVDTTMAVWESLVCQTNSEDIGLISGSKIRLQLAGVLGYVMMNSSSLLVALEKLCVYQRLVASIIFCEVIPKGKVTRIEYTMQEEWKDNFRYTVDFTLSALVFMIRNCTVAAVSPLKVGFHFPKPANYKTYLELFELTEVEFGCDHSYITYSSIDLENKVSGSDGDMYKHFDAMLSSAGREHDRLNQYTRLVRKSIEKSIAAEAPKVEDIAQELGLSVRGLQVNLKNEGTTFQSILKTVRKELSIVQLKNRELNITDVAFLAGFSDISVFSRNFKKWTGLTPSEFKAEH